MAAFTFYCCTECGAMSMRNFRDEWCQVCRVTGRVNQVNFYFYGDSGVEVLPAPHTQDTDD